TATSTRSWGEPWLSILPVRPRKYQCPSHGRRKIEAHSWEWASGSFDRVRLLAGRSATEAAAAEPAFAAAVALGAFSAAVLGVPPAISRGAAGTAGATAPSATRRRTR